MARQPTIKPPPWQRIIVIRPGCEEEIKKVGEEARKIEGPIIKTVIIDLAPENHLKYPTKQERGN